MSKILIGLQTKTSIMKMSEVQLNFPDNVFKQRNWNENKNIE